MRKLSVLLIVVLVVSLVSTVFAQEIEGGSIQKPGTLWTNGWYDGISRMASEEDIVLQFSARTADDFVLGEACPMYDIATVRATLISDKHWVPAREGGWLEVYEAANEGPADGPIATFQSYAVYQIATGVYQYWFNTTGLQLERGTWWLSAAGRGDNGDGHAYMATSWGSDQAWNDNAWFKSADLGFDEFVPISDVYYPDAPQDSDYAFDIDGQCAAGVFMHVDAMTISYRLRLWPQPIWEVTTTATIKDTFGALVWGATVHGEMTNPNGAVTDYARNTNRSGVVTFNHRDLESGVYEFCVTDITKAGFLYEPNNNVVDPPCMTITVAVP